MNSEEQRREILVWINNRPHCVELWPTENGEKWHGHTTFDVGILGQSVPIQVVIPTAAVRNQPMSDEELANEMAALIYERSQMTQGDADDLAWDLLNLIAEKRP